MKAVHSLHLPSSENVGAGRNVEHFGAKCRVDILTVRHFVCSTLCLFDIMFVRHYVCSTLCLPTFCPSTFCLSTFCPTTGGGERRSEYPQLRKILKDVAYSANENNRQNSFYHFHFVILHVNVPYKSASECWKKNVVPNLFSCCNVWKVSNFIEKE